MSESAGYNERLFEGRGLRQYLHSARFHWVCGAMVRNAISADTIVEVGCFDGKLLDWLPAFPSRYVGIDANWEGGLNIARRRFEGDERVTLIETSDPNVMKSLGRDFDMAVSMETLEHVPPEILGDYLKNIAASTAGYALFTVPNEKGLVFGAKWLFKKLIHGDAEKYTFSELVNAVLGRMDKVARCQHKGFDYSAFVREVEQDFDVVSVESIPFRGLPLWLSFGVGVVAKPLRSLE